MIGVPSQASTGTFQVDKVPSQADKSHADKEHPNITLCWNALSGKHRDLFQVDKSCPLGTIWDPFTPKEDPLLRSELSCEV